jgi:hypothetical protein
MSEIKGILELTALFSTGCKRTQAEVEFLAVEDLKNNSELYNRM